eukprot:473214_1
MKDMKPRGRAVPVTLTQIDSRFLATRLHGMLLIRIVYCTGVKQLKVENGNEEISSYDSYDDEIDVDDLMNTNKSFEDEDSPSEDKSRDDAEILEDILYELVGTEENGNEEITSYDNDDDKIVWAPDRNLISAYVDEHNESWKHSPMQNRVVE